MDVTIRYSYPNGNGDGHCNNAMHSRNKEDKLSLQKESVRYEGRKEGKTEILRTRSIIICDARNATIVQAMKNESSAL